jgi:hypothetical protein
VSDILTSENAARIPWQAEQLRCTNFFEPLFDVSADSVFGVFTGSEPTHISENRQQALQTATGIFNNFKLDVVKIPGRLDMVLHSGDESSALSPGISVLGPWTEVVGVFDDGVKAWLQTHPKLQRLAFGTIVVDEVEDRVAGYKVLNQLLPKVDIDVEHSSDFFYQINRPRLVKFGDQLSIKINRLSKWSVASVISHTVTVMAKERFQRPSNVVASIRNYSRAELDLSTDPEVLELPTAQIEAIWKTLLDLARELLSKGDTA